MRSAGVVPGSLLAVLCSPGFAAAADVPVDAGRGSVVVHVPPGYVGQPTPLFVFLHGWNASGQGVEDYFRFEPLAEQHGFFYVTPDALPRFLGIRDWDPNTTCCGGSNNDSLYLRDLIAAVRAELAVDERRIFVGGYSSGGGMAFRMACDHAALLAGVVAIAGTMQDPPVCAADAPIHVLAVHGVADTFAWYGGSALFGGYLGAVEVAQYWGQHSGCVFPAEQLLSAFDLDQEIAGAESDVLRFQAGCAAGGSDELWSIQGGGHAPAWTGEFREAVFQFLATHSKPDPLTDFCRGDGSGGACPCANWGAAGHGCDNSFATGGALLTALSTTRPDELLLVGSALPPGSPTVLPLRSRAGATVPSDVFGDGLLCLEPPLVRLQARTATDGGVRIAITHGAAPGPYDYQLWYRNTQAFCTPAGFNLSNALRHVWQ